MAVVLVTWLAAGALDAGAALLFFLARGGKKPGMLFRYIASGVFGPGAFEGGDGMAWLGLCFHFIIMLGGGLYFVAFPKAVPLILSAIMYGIFVWCGMNLIVVPFSRAVPRPLTAGFVIVNMLILIFAIGLPCAFAMRL